MGEPGPAAGTDHLFPTLAKVLQAELDQLKQSRHDLTLCAGQRVGSFAGFTYYRFEIPEETFQRTTERALFILGRQETVGLEGNVITIDNQYLTVALPRDLGSVIPEIRCSWSPDHHLGPVLEALAGLDPASSIPNTLLNPSAPENVHAVSFDVSGFPSTPPEQLEAVRKILRNKVTLLWGSVRCGKTHTLALAAATYLKAGKRVLFVTATNDNVDEMLLRTVEVGTQLGMHMDSIAARVDLPSLPLAQQIAPYSFDHQIEVLKEDKRKVFQERVSLLQTYWRVHTKQVLHEDFYQRVHDTRTKAAEVKRQADALAKEMRALAEAIGQYEHASVLERLKRGFSKEDVESAQKQLAERQQQHKRLTASHHALTDDAVLMEANAPVTSEELREFKAAMQKMDELGGLEKVTQAVDAFIAVDEPALLRTKQFIATSVTTAFVDPVIRSQKYDLVLVDEAQTVNLPTLAALAGLAREKIVVAGDPFQLQPESSTNTDLAKQFLQRDIFLYVAETDELNRMFDWTEQHPQVCIFLSAHYATTPKLSMFLSSVLYDDRINVFVFPTAHGRILFLDTSEIQSRCKQYAGRKRILPYNELQTKRTIECIKHALMEPDRRASDIGVVYPFTGPTLYTKLMLRLQGMNNIEVGTPQTFVGRRKKAIIFDTTMAGADYTMRSIDDRKVGEHRIARLFNTVLSCVGDDLYVLADMSHFRVLYKDRLLVRLLMLLEAEADQKNPSISASVRKFDEMDIAKRAQSFVYTARTTLAPVLRVAKSTKEEAKIDAELEVKLQMLSKQREGKEPIGGRDFEREVHIAVERVMGYRRDINLLSQFLGSDLLFRSTFSVEEAMSQLPWALCQNEKQFREIMEQWNLLIYEMSGGAKSDLSAFSPNSPESRVRQDLRNLRSLYSMEVKAIMEEGKQRIAVEVSKVFQDLVGRGQLPGNPDEWSRAYITFLGRLEAYLSWISDQLRR